MKKIAIIGSGQLGQQLAYHIYNDTKDKLVGFFDDTQPKNKFIANIPVLGGVNKIVEEFEKKSFDHVIIGIGYNHMAIREKIYNELNETIPFYTFVHSSAYVDSSSKIGQGAIIYPRCLIDQRVVIEENVLLNISSIIAHDTVIGKHSFISPSVAVAGFSKIGEQCIIGINSTIIDNISICEDVRLGGGTVVTKNIEKAGLYVGNPARLVR